MGYWDHLVWGKGSRVVVICYCCISRGLCWDEDSLMSGYLGISLCEVCVAISPLGVDAVDGVVEVYSWCCAAPLHGFCSAVPYCVSLVSFLSALCRFRAGAQQVVDAVALRQSASKAAKKSGASRFAAVVDLERIVDSHPHKESILKALKKKADKDYTGGKKLSHRQLYSSILYTRESYCWCHSN